MSANLSDASGSVLEIEPVEIGIVGGSGLYQMAELTDIEEIDVSTPFGNPSDSIRIGRLDCTPVAFLARHGRTHSLLPTEIPFRANIYALKTLGVKYLLSASAVGSLQPHIAPLDMMVPHQFIDRTRHRVDTFFGNGIVAHISFANPVCDRLAQLLATAARSVSPADITVHDRGTYVCIEGPAFSTLAESLLYKSWNADIVGMTNLTEAKLAREAEIAYASLALVTDYDCWQTDREPVSVEMVIGNLRKNATNAQTVLQDVVRRLAAEPLVSDAHSALKFSILTDLSKVNPERLNELKAILSKYNSNPL
ncbi:MAG: S-methyl-5'-thioadenosine phosphorylase [Synechococcus sp.]